jgi:cytosine/adenosine deaminase-related metal-dependent hydrolase
MVLTAAPPLAVAAQNGRQCGTASDGSCRGSLEPGKLADIAIFDLDTPHATPATNPIASLVYSNRS